MCKTLHCALCQNCLSGSPTPAHHARRSPKLMSIAIVLSLSLSLPLSLTLPPSLSCLFMSIYLAQRQSSFSTTLLSGMFAITELIFLFPLVTASWTKLSCLPVPVSLFIPLSLPSGWPQPGLSATRSFPGPSWALVPTLGLTPEGKEPGFVQCGAERSPRAAMGGWGVNLFCQAWVCSISFLFLCSTERRNRNQNIKNLGTYKKSLLLRLLKQLSSEG